jgi:hypothetical protein
MKQGDFSGNWQNGIKLIKGSAMRFSHRICFTTKERPLMETCGAGLVSEQGRSIYLVMLLHSCSWFSL